MTTVQEVHTALDKLNTLGAPDAIAWELEAQGIQARRGSAYSCAVAQFLGNRPPGEQALGRGNVLVGGEYVLVRDSERNVAGHVALPEIVQDFIQRFDRGEYPAITNPSLTHIAVTVTG